MKKKLFLAVIMAVAMMICAAVSVSAAAVAKIGDQEFDSMGAAIPAANAQYNSQPDPKKPVVIEMINNTTVYNPQTVTGDIVIQGEYTILDKTGPGVLFDIQNGAKLTLKGGLTIDGNNAWTFDDDKFETDLENGNTLSSDGNPLFIYGESADPATSTIGTFALFMVNGELFVENTTIQNYYCALNSGGSCVFYEAEDPSYACMDEDTEAVYRVEGEDYILCRIISE